MESAREQARANEEKAEKAEKETIEQAVKDLNEAIMPIGAKMYEAVESDAEKSDDKSSKADKKAKKSKKSIK